VIEQARTAALQAGEPRQFVQMVVADSRTNPEL